MSKKKKEIRSKIIRIRVTESEHQILKDNAEGRQVSPWLRTMGLGTKPENIPKASPKGKKVAPTVDPLLIRELARIGNNLNQLARVANENKKNGFDFNALEVLGKLQAMDDELRMLREVHDDR